MVEEVRAPRAVRCGYAGTRRSRDRTRTAQAVRVSTRHRCAPPLPAESGISAECGTPGGNRHRSSAQAVPGAGPWRGYVWPVTCIASSRRPGPRSSSWPFQCARWRVERHLPSTARSCWQPTISPSATPSSSPWWSGARSRSWPRLSTSTRGRTAWFFRGRRVDPDQPHRGGASPSGVLETARNEVLGRGRDPLPKFGGHPVAGSLDGHKEPDSGSPGLPREWGRPPSPSRPSGWLDVQPVNSYFMRPFNTVIIRCSAR